MDDYAEFVNFKCLMYTGLMVYLGIPQMDTKQVKWGTFLVKDSSNQGPLESTTASHDSLLNVLIVEKSS